MWPVSRLPRSSVPQTKGTDIITPEGSNASHKCSVHHWAEHGIAGRGVLLDYRGYAKKKGIEYDPYDYYPISFEVPRPQNNKKNPPKC